MPAQTRSRGAVKHSSLVFAFALAILNVFAQPIFIPQARGALLPKQSCKEAWSKLIPTNAHKYAFRKDAHFTIYGNEGYSEYQKRTQRKSCYKDWTVLIYMQAENNLYLYSLWDLYEMEAGFQNSLDGAGSTLRTDVIVQLDARGDDKIRRLHVFESSDEPYQTQTLDYFSHRSEKDVRSPIAQLLNKNDFNSASESQRLEDFIQWAISEYPSQHYWVVVWGHGKGWKSSASPDQGNGGLAYNERTQSVLDIPSLAQILSRTSMRLNKELDFYTSDACLMQTVEVVDEIASSVRFTSGTSQIQSFLGLPYRRIFYELNSGHFNGERKNTFSSDEAELLARMLPTLTQQSFAPKRGSQGRSDHQAYAALAASSVDNEKFRTQLIPALFALSRSLRQFLREDAIRKLDLLFAIQTVSTAEGHNEILDLNVFLGLLLKKLTQEATRAKELSPVAQKLFAQAQLTAQTLRQSIVSYAVGSELPDSRALSLWFPLSPEAYQKRKLEFLSSTFYRQTEWNDWLQLLYE